MEERNSRQTNTYYCVGDKKSYETLVSKFTLLDGMIKGGMF